MEKKKKKKKAGKNNSNKEWANRILGTEKPALEEAKDCPGGGKGHPGVQAASPPVQDRVLLGRELHSEERG